MSQGLAWVDSTQLPNLQEAELERLLGTVKNRRTGKNRQFRTEQPRNRKWNRNRNRNNLSLHLMEITLYLSIFQRPCSQTFQTISFQQSGAFPLKLHKETAVTAKFTSNAVSDVVVDVRVYTERLQKDVLRKCILLAAFSGR